MKAVGIIAEYNPFHNGHLYQIEEAKQQTGARHAVVVLNGSFVQRGAPAVADKYTRTEMALKGGADLVFELPVRYGVSSAEYFAFGAAALLHSLPFVGGVCFGSECGNPELLGAAADFFLHEPEDFKKALKEELLNGLTYPAARARAALSRFPDFDPAAVKSCLLSPNDILGIEYMKALRRLGSPLSVHVIKRRDAGYHGTRLEGPFCSATAIRHACAGDSLPHTLGGCVPPECLSLLKQARHKTFPILDRDFSSFLFPRLLMEQDFTGYADITPDLNRRILKMRDSYTGFPEFAAALKSRQYTRTRINRCLIHILLGIRPFPADMQKEGPIPYARLLGLKKSASRLLRQKNPAVPLITKTADAGKQLSPLGKEMLSEDIRASSLYNYAAYQKFGHPIPNDYRRSPVILP